MSTASIAEEQLQRVIDAEALNQTKVCRIADLANRDDDLVAAIYRRVARELAARGIPLGTAPGSEEFGPTRLASFDAEIERLEGADRKIVFG